MGKPNQPPRILKKGPNRPMSIEMRGREKFIFQILIIILLVAYILLMIRKMS